MNCQKGDMAIVVKSYAGHEGKIVTCLKFVGKVRGLIGEDYWETDTNTRSEDGRTVDPHLRDSWMRPIRDQPGEDETLTWAPVPQKEMV